MKAHVLILISKHVLLWLPTRRQSASSYSCNGSVFLACLAAVAVVDRAIKQCCCCQKTCITSCAPGDLSWNKTHETEREGAHAAKGFMNTVQFVFFSANDGAHFVCKMTSRSCLVQYKWSKHVLVLEVDREFEMRRFCAVLDIFLKKLYRVLMLPFFYLSANRTHLIAFFYYHTFEIENTCLQMQK